LLLDRQVSASRAAIHHRRRQRYHDLWHPVDTHRFEQSHRAGKGRTEFLHGCSTTRQRRQVVHDVRFSHPDERCCFRAGNVEVVEPQRPARRSSGHSRFGKIGEGAGAEVVDHIHAVALGKQTINEMRSEKAGTSDDHHVHRATIMAQRQCDDQR